MAIPTTIRITPVTLTDLIIIVESTNSIEVKTLADCTVGASAITLKLPSPPYDNINLKFYAQGYSVATLENVSGAGNQIELTPTSDYIKTSDNTNDYYVKDNYSRKFGADLLSIVMTKADSSDIPDVSNFVTNTSLATTLQGYVTSSSLTTVLTRYQPLLESGINIKTINNINLLGSGNIDTREIYTAVFDESTFTDVQNAYNSGKIIKCNFLGKIGSVTCYLVFYNDDYFVFMGESRYREVDNIQYIFLRLDSNDNWIYWRKENADTTLSNVSSINSNSAVATALDGKVSKSGDTMTGQLIITSSETRIEQNDTDVVKGTNPSSNTFWGMIFNASGGDDTYQSKRLGYIEETLRPDGSTTLNIGTYQNVANSTTVSRMSLNMTQAGVASCTFPDTECVDSKVYNTNKTLLDNGNLSVAEHSYSLSSYLPNDGKVYEIFLEIRGRTGATSGNYALIWADGGTTGCNLVYTITRASNYQTFCGYGSVYVSSARNLKIKLTGNATTNTTINIRGYRRVGTNN